jgi:hypothetical protein
MPGHFIVAYCPCGFECSLSPGSRTPGHLKVMAYSSNHTKPINIDSFALKLGEENLIITIDEKEALQRGLSIINDPALDADVLGDNRDGPWGGYRCPACQQDTMSFQRTGFWD